MSKTILEKALLEAEQLEETMRSNAKEILSSTMKEEIHELVKESLSENDYLEEQEDEQEVEIDLDIEDLEDEADMVDLEEPMMDLDLELDVEDDTEDDEVSLELPPLDLTLASDAEVLKVFKAMGDEDGIIIQQDDEEIELTDTNTDTEYLIKLEQSKKSKTMKEEKSMKNDEVEETTDNKKMDEVVYEIELDEDMHEGGVEGVYAPESEKGQKSYDKYLDRTNIEETDDSEMEEEMYEEKHEDMEEEMTEGQSYGDRRHEREGMRKHYGKTPDALHRLSGAKQGYDDREDESLGMLHREGDAVEGEVDEMWGSKKHEYKRTKGHKTGDVDGHYKDYEMEGELEETSRLKAGPNKSFSKMAGQKVWGKKNYNESRRPRKANLGESRIRKSYNLLKEEVDSLKSKNVEYKKALITFKDKLNEVGVFNSNLAYVTRLFTEHSTTKKEKINILKRFDNVKTLKESKGLYKVIRQEFSQEVTDNTKTISESVERKITKSSTSGSGGKLLESKVYENPQFSRMKDLMSKL
eukprot:SAG11_NODE_1_length_64905_cov_182.268355_54_plen_525_part_00